MTSDAGSPGSGHVIDLFSADHRRFEDPLRDLGAHERDRARSVLSFLHVAHAEARRRVYPALRRRVVERARADGLLTT